LAYGLARSEVTDGVGDGVCRDTKLERRKFVACAVGEFFIAIGEG